MRAMFARRAPRGEEACPGNLQEIVRIRRLASCREAAGRACARIRAAVRLRARGLILQFECENGRMRLIIAGPSLPLGNREILFDDEGREAAAGTMLGRFRRPSWLT
jgi:hypothetical protein